MAKIINLRPISTGKTSVIAYDSHFSRDFSSLEAFDKRVYPLKDRPYTFVFPSAFSYYIWGPVTPARCNSVILETVDKFVDDLFKFRQDNILFDTDAGLTRLKLALILFKKNGISSYLWPLAEL